MYVLNPNDLAENMRKYGGFIPGIRPGKKTAEYIDRVLSRITLPGAIYLGLVAVLFGSTLFGILGALLAIPAAASIQIGLHEYREYRREVAAAEEEAGGPTPAPEVT